MSREIKFRAWNSKQPEMIMLGNLIDVHWNIRFIFKNYKIMQFTGLKDKNGVEIYEGDIVRTVWKGIIGETYNEPQVKECPMLEPEYFHWYAELEDMEVEVIGNIYENPELLNQPTEDGDE